MAQHVAGFLAPGALEPPASVAEAVSSLTIADAFIAAGESPTPPPAALPRRFICSFPDCSANYNKAWKLDAHLCKHTGEVKKRQAWPGRAWHPDRGPVMRRAPGGLCPTVPRVDPQGSSSWGCRASTTWASSQKPTNYALDQGRTEEVDRKF